MGRCEHTILSSLFLKMNCWALGGQGLSGVLARMLRSTRE